MTTIMQEYIKYQLIAKIINRDDNVFKKGKKKKKIIL